MAKILILFGTNYGQTRKVANHIAEVVRSRGHDVEEAQGNKLPDDFTPKDFDAAIIGTSINLGVHQISIRKLVKNNEAAFNSMPCAYFCVCLSAYGTKPQDKEQVDKFLNDFIQYTGLKPVKTAAFAGALRYPYYNFVRRFAAKLVARRVGADTYTKNEYEYTNWEAVTKFTTDFVDSL
ncbi:MAG: protoporphyrinogen oxidase [Chloroflexi bacterium]|jgi:menaquinone-dependent protoporphyrinogen oxidase|nr:protoporphyrinogen oxidase [Chloroflexota bacterium]